MVLVALLAGAAAGCAERLDERFAVQAEESRYFVRERGGAFSALLPCSPRFSRRKLERRSAPMIHASCEVDGQVVSLSYRALEAAPASAEQLYDDVTQELEVWRDDARTTAAPAVVAGRPARYVAFDAIDGGRTDAAVWFVWVEEQRTLYQIMVVGTGGRRLGERVLRSLQVPSL